MPQMSTHFDFSKPLELSIVRRAFVIAIATALVGCEGSVTVDMGTNAPADPAINSVLVDIAGIELQGGGAETLTFDEPVRVNLVEFIEGNLFRLFTDEELPDGRYTGVRLLISSDDDDDNEDVVTWSDGREFELTVAEGQAAAVSFTVDKDDSTEEDVILTLDLRQSLSFIDSGTDRYALTPVLRGVRSEDAGRIVGTVASRCPSGASLASGGAVYLFNAHDRTPDDRDGADEEPYLTTRVLFDGTNAVPTYNFRFVPDGDYTIALTCDANEDDAATSDDLRFQNTTNIRVRAEETLTQNFD